MTIDLSRIGGRPPQVFVKNGLYPNRSTDCTKQQVAHCSDNLLPPSKHVVKNQTSLPYPQMNDFMVKLQAYEDTGTHPLGHTTSASLLEFIILNTVRKAEWREIDIPNKVWIVPPQHLKTGKKYNRILHIPLSEPALEVIKQMQEKGVDQSRNALVFPSPSGGKYSHHAVLDLIPRFWDELVRNPDDSMSPATVHGFRATFTAWALATGYTQREIDIQLDHVVGPGVRAAYDHYHPAEDRRPMMDAWGKHCTRPTPAAGTNVTEFKRRRVV
jgi:hypothetical protein